MKTLPILYAFAAVTLTSCGMLNTAPMSTGSADSAGAADFAGPGGTYQHVPRSAITSLDVSVGASGGEAAEHETYTGKKAAHVLSRLHLEAPEQSGDTGDRVTGQLDIYYQYKGQDYLKVLTIRNAEYAEDRDFPQIRYRSALPLDSSLIGQ